MRNVLQLQRNTPTTSGVGDPLEKWTTYDVVHAEDMPSTAREFYAWRQTMPQTLGMFRIRWRKDILPSDRILLGKRTLQILGAYDPSGGDRQELLIPYSEYSTGT